MEFQHQNLNPEVTHKYLEFDCETVQYVVKNNYYFCRLIFSNIDIVVIQRCITFKQVR